MTPKRGELYEHFRGETYQITGSAICEKTLKVLVLYKNADELAGSIWARPVEEFADIHPEHNVKRFTKISTSEYRGSDGY